jgi:imidazolonepropionase-like amidohydrolase
MPNILSRTSIALLLCLLACPAAMAASLAIVNGTVIDGTGSAPLKKAVVVIEGERIAAVGPAGKVTIPEGAEVIDAKGKFVIPGLMDANVHLFFGSADLEMMYRFEGRYDELIIEAAQVALKTGQTTVYDTWGPLPGLVKARDKINSGEALGSRIFLAGNIIGFDGPYSADFAANFAEVVTGKFATEINEMWQQGVGRELMWRTPQEVGERVEEYATKGMDFLKYASSGHQEMYYLAFSPRVQRTIVDVGHRAGMTVQAHVSSPESLDIAIDAGLDIATHCDISGLVDPIPAETIQKMVDRGVACSVLPITQARLKFLKGEMPSSPVTPYHTIAETNLRNMIKAGVILLMSTDAGIFRREIEEHYASKMGMKKDVDPSTKLGVGHFNALVALEELGMEPMEVLKSATSNIAKAYKNDADLGTLESGKYADLVILDKNPLKSAANYRSIHTVIKSGQVVDLEALPDEPNVTADWAEETGDAK